MYADDMVCVCRTEAQATRAIIIVEDEARRLELTINPKKSGVLVMYKGKPKKKPQGTFRGYPLVEEYRYLGTWIGRTL